MGTFTIVKNNGAKVQNNSLKSKLFGEMWEGCLEKIEVEVCDWL
jgi:hypothetical protein